MISLSFARRMANCFGATCFLVFAWKFILLAFTAQPIPANDAYGYDGAVVNYLVNGHYNNPSIAIPFPFSGTNTYCAYPPLYQAALYPWMSVFGTSALAAMWFHLVLFGLYLLTLLAVFRRLKAPAWAVNLAGLFLFGITFDDRPDGLAQLFGMLAVYTWVRSVESPNAVRCRWPWLATALVTLTFCTNPEIGGLYCGWLWLLALGSTLVRKQKFPVVPMGVMVLAPVALVVMVKCGRPDLWAGFMEHAGQTPSFTHLRIPAPGDFIKMIRTIPGILLIAAILLVRIPGAVFNRRLAADLETNFPASLLVLSAVLISLGLTLGGLVMFTANWILILAHFQPLIVGAFLALEARREGAPNRWLNPVLVMLVLLVSVRAIGMSTWGVACALDISESKARQIVRKELDKTPPDSTLVMSTAFLYDATKYSKLTLIHEDWTHSAREPEGKLNGDTMALIKLKPAGLILTQFDFYRRYRLPLTELRAAPEVVTMKISDAAKVRPPDSYPRFQQVVQHVSWAPVIIEFDWK